MKHVSADTSERIWVVAKKFLSMIRIHNTLFQYDPYDPHGFNFQPICKEVGQETCFNIPSVEAIDVPVNLQYPEPIR